MRIGKETRHTRQEMTTPLSYTCGQTTWASPLVYVLCRTDRETGERARDTHHKTSKQGHDSFPPSLSPSLPSLPFPQNRTLTQARNFSS